MNVMLIGDYPPPQGGVAVHMRQLHLFLRSQGVNTTVLDIGKGGQPAPDVLPVRTGPRFVRLLAAFVARGWLSHLHTSGNNVKSWWLAAAVGAAAKLSRTGGVITLHSGLLPAFLAESPSRRLLARAALAGYAQVIAVSDAVARALEECGVPAARILVYPAFCASQVKAEAPPPGFAEARARRSPLIAMAHHPSPVYGRALMLRALAALARQHPRVGLAVFGPGTRSPEFIADAQAAGVADRIEDFGELAHGSALALLQGCDAFARPTTADGDSISVREALVLGVPCVASDVCPRPAGVWIFRDGDAGGLARTVDAALVGGPGASTPADAGPVVLALYRRLAEGQGQGAAAVMGP